jgi:dihydrodiol dehydrogenase / D-xylose 1-dehydrogenase (NADP)
MSLPFTLKWGIIGCGKISHDFASSLSSLPPGEHVVVACAARKLGSSKAFSTEHGIPKAYGSYEELLKDPEVQVVYIGAINPQHKDLSKLAIDHGKGVLCEKPLCINVKETKELVNYAREKNVFLMEV